MSIQVALHHRTTYRYDRPVTLSPHVVRLRPAPHCRTPILGYSLKIEPKDHFLNWQQDPYSNHLARLVFAKPTQELVATVDLIAEMKAINAFDFFVEESAQRYPLVYEPLVARELMPYMATAMSGARFETLVGHVKRELVTPEITTVDLLVAINQLIHGRLTYLIRMEPGVQSPEQTLELGSGSCRDFAWLLVNVLRRLGVAARFVSGYSIQLVADVKPLDGPEGVTADCCDLHAWGEAYVPGAGWIGLDATSGLFTAEGHIPLACSAEPLSAAPITGAFAFSSQGEGDQVEQTFDVKMTVKRIAETPRVTKPYTPVQWRDIDALGHKVDRDLEWGDARLTMGGEPTFVSVDDMDGEEWNTAALGEMKRKRAGELVRRLYKQFAPGGLLHFGQGKWYPGEQLPRWALACFWRKDGHPIWVDPTLIPDDGKSYNFDEKDAQRFITTLAGVLNVDGGCAQAGYEDAWHYMWRERRLPVNVDPFDSRLRDPMERERLASVFERGLERVVGYCLPLARCYLDDGAKWVSGPWFFRPERMYLLPGDSAMGYRLPLDSLPWVSPADYPHIHEQDPWAERLPMGPRRQTFITTPAQTITAGVAEQTLAAESVTGTPSRSRRPIPAMSAAVQDHGLAVSSIDPSWVIRTAVCVQPRDGRLHVFMPPVRHVEDYLDLIAAVEHTAAQCRTPVVIEGYHPPADPRLDHIKVTPDPGVIEVNMHPASNWPDLVRNTSILYGEARECRLGTEKFMLDGRHTGTGGGNHIVLGAARPADSPFLRRPDLLASLLRYWINHPSLSYLFSGLFVGPTSQAPRADEGRTDAMQELEIALAQIPEPGRPVPPWIIDRILRNLLVDVTGNTHRAEFCIDKLYSPDSSSGRLGLLELRPFEMPPHPHMSLVQQLLVRALIARFWKEPYTQPLIHWGTQLHGKFLLPHFVRQDVEDVLGDLAEGGYKFETAWFDPHLEFRFARIGSVVYRGVAMELRQAIEPWNVLGEEPAGGATARFVDSSLERLEVKVRGMVDGRHVVACNGVALPLHPTGVAGEFVAGVRYRAWQPAACLHPTIGVHTPLVFDLIDTWSGRAIGGCTYHVTHPGGRSFETFPVNAAEAESRRGARFQAFGHTPGPMEARAGEPNDAHPCILDLRRS